MGVVIDQVVGRVEPEARPAAGSAPGGEAAARGPQKDLQCQLRKLESRRLRLAAD